MRPAWHWNRAIVVQKDGRSPRDCGSSQCHGKAGMVFYLLHSFPSHLKEVATAIPDRQHPQTILSPRHLPDSLKIYPSFMSRHVFHVTHLRPVLSSPLCPSARPPPPSQVINNAPAFPDHETLDIHPWGRDNQYLVDKEGAGPEEMSWTLPSWGGGSVTSAFSLWSTNPFCVLCSPFPSCACQDSVLPSSVLFACSENTAPSQFPALPRLPLHLNPLILTCYFFPSQIV